MDNVKYRLKVEATNEFLNFSFKTTVANSKIDWGDGTVQTYSSTGSHSHFYASAGTYIIESDDVGFNGGRSSSSNQYIKELEILDGVTTIGNDAFYKCEALTSLVISDSVTSIGNTAFESCKALTSLTLGNGLTSIGTYAFDACKALTSLVIPDSVTTIGSGAFYGCNALTSLVIPDSVTSIGSYAFQSCKALTSLVIPDSVTSIGSYAFINCNALTSLVIPDSVTSIGNDAFQSCYALTSLTLGNGVTTIGNDAFLNCYALTSLVIPDSVTTIGISAFYYCNALTSLTLGNGLTSIGNNAFFNGAFTSVNYTGTQAEWNALLPNIKDSKVKAATVNFVKTITYDTNGGSSIPDYVGLNYPNPLPVPTKTDYTFVGWFEESTLTTPVVAGAAITESHTIYAKWEESFLITYETNGGSSIPDYEGKNYPDPLPVPTKAGYKFVGWFEESALITPVVAGGPISESHTIYAKWAEIEYEVYQKTDSGIVKLKIKGDKIVPNSAEPTTAKLTKLAINDTNFSLAGGGASVYADYSAMVTSINAMDSGALELGWNIYIRTVEVPDLWISKNDEAISVPYTYTTDAQFIEDLNTAASTGLQIGYFRVNKLETEKVFIPVEDVTLNGSSIVNNGIAAMTRMAETSFSCEMADGTTKTLKLYSELT